MDQQITYKRGVMCFGAMIKQLTPSFLVMAWLYIANVVAITPTHSSKGFLYSGKHMLVSFNIFKWCQW